MWTCVVALLLKLRVGRRYYRAAWLGWKHGVVGMDFLVSLGVGGSYLNSVVVLGVQAVNPMFDKPVMFETAGMLLAFVTLGKFLETSARGHTTAALAKLAEMRVRTATVRHAHAQQCMHAAHTQGCSTVRMWLDVDMKLTHAFVAALAPLLFRPPYPSLQTSQPRTAVRVACSDPPANTQPMLSASAEEEVPAASLKKGDVIKVLPGHAVPVDGVVLRGESYVPSVHQL